MHNRVLPDKVFRDVQTVSHIALLIQNKAAWALCTRNLHHSPLLQFVWPTVQRRVYISDGGAGRPQLSHHRWFCCHSKEQFLFREDP